MEEIVVYIIIAAVCILVTAIICIPLVKKIAISNHVKNYEAKVGTAEERPERSLTRLSKQPRQRNARLYLRQRKLLRQRMNSREKQKNAVQNCSASKTG